MSLKQTKRVGKEASPKTKKQKSKFTLPDEQLTRLSVVAKHALKVLEETTEHLDTIILKEHQKLDANAGEKTQEQQEWISQALAQLYGMSSAMKAVGAHIRWELFEKIEPPLT